MDPGLRRGDDVVTQSFCIAPKNAIISLPHLGRADGGVFAVLMLSVTSALGGGGFYSQVHKC